MKVVWKKIPGFENYMISNDGRVKSLPRLSFSGQKVKRKILKQCLDSPGYLYVSLYKNRRRKGGRIHRLVALMFLPPDSKRTYVNHKNGIKTDNRIQNLEWVTDQENRNHSKINNLIPYGECHGRSKLKEKYIKFIINSDKSNTELGLKFGVTRASIRSIRIGKNWVRTVSAIKNLE